MDLLYHESAREEHARRALEEATRKKEEATRRADRTMEEFTAAEAEANNAVTGLYQTILENKMKYGTLFERIDEVVKIAEAAEASERESRERVRALSERYLHDHETMTARMQRITNWMDETREELRALLERRVELRRAIASRRADIARAEAEEKALEEKERRAEDLRRVLSDVQARREVVKLAREAAVDRHREVERAVHREGRERDEIEMQAIQTAREALMTEIEAQRAKLLKMQSEEGEVPGPRALSQLENRWKSCEAEILTVINEEKEMEIAREAMAREVDEARRWSQGEVDDGETRRGGGDSNSKENPLIARLRRRRLELELQVGEEHRKMRSEKFSIVESELAEVKRALEGE